MTSNTSTIRVEKGICTRCGCAFVFDYTNAHRRKYCDVCRPMSKKEYYAQWQRVWRQTPEGRVLRAKALSKYLHTEKGQVNAAHCVAKYNLSPKGQARLAKKTAQRRVHSTDPELYATRVELLHTLQEPCTKCGAQFKVTHQIDHVVALCLGGTDEWSNLQPLCILCHREKTAEDMREFRQQVCCPTEGIESWAERLRHTLGDRKQLLRSN